MNTKQLIAAAVLTLVGSAGFAAEVDNLVAPASTLTRAEVRAELIRARANHELQLGEQDAYGYRAAAVNTGPSTTTRAEVVAELVRARANNELPRNDVDTYGANATQPTQTASTLTRAEVRAQAREYVKSGQAYRDSINAYNIGG